MLAEMTFWKGRLVSPLASLARYSSDLTASSPLTAYLAVTTWGLMFLMFSRVAGVDDMVLWWGGSRWAVAAKWVCRGVGWYDRGVLGAGGREAVRETED
jgi:hypothetical protein